MNEINKIHQQDGSERRQKRFVIEKDFQSRFTLKICLFAGGLVLAYGILILLMVRLNYEMLLQHAMMQMPTAIDTLKREYRTYSLLLVGVLVIVIPFLYGIGLLLTQKIAGPLIAVQKRLRDFGNGKKGVRLRLRDGDEFKNIESIFNFAMSSFDERQDIEIKNLELLKRFVREKNFDECERVIQSMIDLKNRPQIGGQSSQTPIPGEF